MPTCCGSTSRRSLQQQQMWNSALGSIESAFNSQLRGLLAGTTTWSQAFKKILGDLIIKFIEMCETDGGEMGRRAAGADDGVNDRRCRARCRGTERVECRHAEHHRQRREGDHDRCQPSLCRRVRLSGADHGAGGGRTRRGGAGFGLCGGDLRCRHRLRRARRSRAHSSRRDDHSGGARLRLIQRRRHGRAGPCAGEHQRVGAQFAKRGAFLQRQFAGT